MGSSLHQIAAHPLDLDLTSKRIEYSRLFQGETSADVIDRSVVLPMPVQTQLTDDLVCYSFTSITSLNYLFILYTGCVHFTSRSIKKKKIACSLLYSNEGFNTHCNLLFRGHAVKPFHGRDSEVDDTMMLIALCMFANLTQVCVLCTIRKCRCQMKKCRRSP